MYNTDMADERVDEYKEVHNLSDVDGLEVIKKDFEEFSVIKVNVLNDKGKEAIEKDIGTYITYEMKDVNYIEDKEKVIESLKNEIEQ